MSQFSEQDYKLLAELVKKKDKSVRIVEQYRNENAKIVEWRRNDDDIFTDTGKVACDFCEQLMVKSNGSHIRMMRHLRQWNNPNDLPTMDSLMPDPTTDAQGPNPLPNLFMLQPPNGGQRMVHTPISNQWNPYSGS
ncbi:hypothetical protein B9Z55_021319 [Caenorhabditis nigoni]|uniref:BED-type domain-containing protein n=1 Tax=Caenorhabditis nigoni TaxID=1611254 RepID=A0A2G5TS30_9PELO|nr:hypothetical protein B9Z55_021319 [Caenorhabditis nigoni]